MHLFGDCAKRPVVYLGVKLNNLVKIAAALAFVSSSPTLAAGAPKPVELSSTELGAVQSKSYPIEAGKLYTATIATLQTLGYVDLVSSKDAGTISGTTEAKAKTFYNIFWGFGKKKLTQKASLLVEENGPSGGLVRLNLHVTETKARGIFGTSFSDGRLVRFAEPYRDFFSALDAEVARRSMGVPATQVTPVAASN